MSSGISKIAAERNRRVLMELVMKPGNDVCADCKARAPRWASFNIGIFICMNCASIHRKIGTHITKVKSLTLDEWSKEQVEFMKQNGNIKSNQLYIPDEVRHPPPANLMGTERDSELEKFIRAKYEFKRFMARKPPLAGQRNAVAPPPRTASASAFTQLTRARPTPLSGEALAERTTSPAPPPPPEKTPENMPSRIFLSAAGSSASPSLSSATIPTRSSTFPQHIAPPTRAVSQPLPSSALGTKPTVPSKGEVWDELISLQGSTQNSSLPLQYQSSHSPSAPLPSLPTPASSVIMPSTGVPQSRTFPRLDMPPNPFVNMNATGMGVTTGNPFNTAAMAAAAPLGTSSVNLPTMNMNTNPFTGASLFTPSALPASPIFPLTNGAACTAGPSPFPLGYGSVGGVGTGPGVTNPQQSFGTSSFIGPLTPSLVPNPTGLLFPKPQTPTPSTVPFSGGAISAPHTPSPYSTPFVTGGTLPQQHQPFGTPSTPFLQPQMQFQSPTHPQAQQQAFGHSGFFSGWQG